MEQGIPGGCNTQMRYRFNAAFLACLGTETMLFARELLLQYY